MALVDALHQIAAVLRAVDGIQAVPNVPPEQMNYSVFGVVYPPSGKIEGGPEGTKQSLHNIVLAVLTTRTDLERNMTVLEPFLDSVPLALLREISYDSSGNPGQQFGQTIEIFESISYTWIQTDYGGTPAVGYQFTMENTKIQVNL